MSGQQYEQKTAQIPGALGREIASSEERAARAALQCHPRQRLRAGDGCGRRRSCRCCCPSSAVLPDHGCCWPCAPPADEERGEQSFEGVNSPSAAARTEGRAEGEGVGERRAATSLYHVAATACVL